MHRLTGPLTALLLIALLPTADAEVLRREGKGYLERTDAGQLVLHLKGTPDEMGFQHGKLMTAKIREMIGMIVDNKGELGKKTEYKAYKMMRPLMHNKLRPHVPKRFVAEMKGLARGAGLPYDHVEAANLFPAAFHCSGMALMGKATHDGSLYHVRILDYFTQVGLQTASLIIIHEPDGANAWINVGFAGFIGSVTGMNEKQVTIGEMGGKGMFYWDGMPMAFLIRDALERADTLGAALEIFRTTKRTCEYYYVISDAKIPDARGIWATPDEMEEVGPGESYGFVEYKKPGKGAAGNKSFMRGVKVEHDAHRTVFRGKDGAVKGFIGTPPKDTIVMSGEDRYKHFVDRLVKQYGKVDAKQLIEMIKRPVSMKSNLHNAVFHPKTLTVWVAVAAKDGAPACNQTYHEFKLVKQSAPGAKPAGDDAK